MQLPGARTLLGLRASQGIVCSALLLSSSPSLLPLFLPPSLQQKGQLGERSSLLFLVLFPWYPTMVVRGSISEAIDAFVKANTGQITVEDGEQKASRAKRLFHTDTHERTHVLLAQQAKSPGTAERALRCCDDIVL